MSERGTKNQSTLGQQWGSRSARDGGPVTEGVAPLAKQSWMERLKAGLGGESINLLFGDQQEALLARAELGDLGDRLQLDRDMVRLYLNQAAQAIPTVMNRLQGAEIEPVSLTLTQPSLDDVFLQVTGQRLVTDSSTLAETAQSEQLPSTEVSYR